MTPHSIETWVEILSKLDATHCSAEAAAATRIIGDLIGYRHTSKNRARDEQELANAMQAYARMCVDAGLRP
jgi:hypothetical protein